MMTITATHVNYYHVCERKLWLFSHAIQMEHTSELVLEGKLIGESTYPQRAERYTELELSVDLGEGRGIANVKIDFYDAKNRVVHEVKKSAKIEEAHRAQVKFYLYVLGQSGVEGAKGVLEYPKQRHTEGVELGVEDNDRITRWIVEINRIVALETCPKVINKPMCKTCSYCDFCYADE
jgi:CRISPR-associated exonuclease Cas4